jgi:hypothetical protein
VGSRSYRSRARRRSCLLLAQSGRGGAHLVWRFGPGRWGVGGWGAPGAFCRPASLGTRPVATLIPRNQCIAGDATSAHSLAFSSAIRRTSVCRFVSSDSSGNNLQKRSMFRRATMVSSATLVSLTVRVAIILRLPRIFSGFDHFEVEVLGPSNGGINPLSKSISARRISQMFALASPNLATNRRNS